MPASPKPLDVDEVRQEEWDETNALDDIWADALELGELEDRAKEGTLTKAEERRRRQLAHACRNGSPKEALERRALIIQAAREVLKVSGTGLKEHGGDMSREALGRAVLEKLNGLSVPGKRGELDDSTVRKILVSWIGKKPLIGR